MHPELSRPLDELPDPLPIPAVTGAFDAAVRPPGSKSLTNRALLLASLAAGESTLRSALVDADDAEAMIGAVTRLGAAVSRDGDTLRVVGVGGRWRPRPPADEVRLDARDSGTAARFLAASSLLSPVPIVIDGSDRLRQRPIGELADALGRCGARAEFLGRPGCPPIRLTPPAALPRAAALTLPTTLSSQVISALLLVGPWLPGGLTLTLEGEVTSRSYVAMTTGLLDRLGATVRTTRDLGVVRVGPPGVAEPFAPFDYAVEPDASGATYFWAAAAIVPQASCRVRGIGTHSLQGDAAFPGLLERMGVEVRRDESEPAISCRGPAALMPVLADVGEAPDAAMTLAAVAAFANGTSVIRGLRTLRLKESDRIEAMRAELAKVGVRVDVRGDSDAVTITPPDGGVAAQGTPLVFDTHDDHRMAMSLALIGLRRRGVSIADPRCVSKTYPRFWSDLACLCR